MMNDVFPPSCRNSATVFVVDGPENSDAQYMRSPLALMFTATFLYTMLIKAGSLETVDIIPFLEQFMSDFDENQATRARPSPSFLPRRGDQESTRGLRRLRTISNGVLPNTFCLKGQGLLC